MEKLYVEKAICVMGRYPFFHNYKIFLKELFRIHSMKNNIFPLEVNILYIIYYEKIN
jgi:hypothetical protein